MVHFRNPKKELPKEGQIVLVKFKDRSNDNYYVCMYTKNVHGKLSFVEAWFEGYSWFNIDDILGWIPIEDLNEIQIEGD